MKKILLWMQGAILLCGTNMMTSCSNTDIPAPAPQPEWNDQASLFVMKTLSDQRYQKDMFGHYGTGRCRTDTRPSS